MKRHRCRPPAPMWISNADPYPNKGDQRAIRSPLSGCGSDQKIQIQAKNLNSHFRCPPWPRPSLPRGPQCPRVPGPRCRRCPIFIPRLRHRSKNAGEAGQAKGSRWWAGAQGKRKQCGQSSGRKEHGSWARKWPPPGERIPGGGRRKQGLAAGDRGGYCFE